MQAYTHSRISRKHPTHEKKTKHTHTHIPGENAASYGFSCVCPLVTPTGSDERRETILFTLQRDIQREDEIYLRQNVIIFLSVCFCA